MRIFWCIFAVCFLFACTSGSQRTEVSGSAVSQEGLPSMARATPELVVELSGFPEAIVAADPKPVSPNAEAFIQGTVLWSRVFRTKEGFEAFQVHVCEGPCEVPLIERMRRINGRFPLVTSRSVPLSGGRTLEASLMGVGLGGALVVSKAQSQNGKFTIMAVMNLPPGDIPVSDAARTFFQNADPLEVALALGSGLDARL